MSDSGGVVRPPRSLNVLGIAMLAVTFTGAGPTALETILRSGGGFWAVVFLLLTPIVVSFPQILVVSELGSMMPTQAGALVWVTRGLGPRAGFVYGWIITVVAFSDGALSSILCEGLLMRVAGLDDADVSWAIRVAVRVLLLAAATVVALLDLTHTSHLITPFTVLTLLVVLLGFLAALPSLTWNALTIDSMPQTVDFGTLAVASIWLYNGWIANGVVAGESVDSGTLFRGLGLGLSTVGAQYVLGVLVMVAKAASPADFSKDMYVILAFERVSPVLGFALAIMLVGLTFCATAVTLSVDGRASWGLARLGWAPYYFRAQLQNGTPYRMVILMSIVSMPLTAVNFSTVLVVFYSLSAVGQVMVPMAQLRMRRTMPDAIRPVRVPSDGIGLNIIVVLSQTAALTLVFIANITVNTWLALGVGAFLALVSGLAMTAKEIFVQFEGWPEEAAAVGLPLLLTDSDAGAGRSRPPVGHLALPPPPKGMPNDAVYRALASAGFLDSVLQ